MPVRANAGRTLTWLGLALIGVGLLGLGLRIATRAADLQGRVATLTRLASPGGHADVAQIRVSIKAARADLVDLQGAVAWMFPILPALRPFPAFGADAAQGEALLGWATDLGSAADVLLDGWAPALDGEGPALERIAARLDGQRDQFALARAYLSRADTWRARIKPELLSPRTALLVARMDHLRPLAQMAADGGLTAPDLLGADRPRSYLIVAQNQDELRATGGFVTAAGLLTLEHGRVTALNFMDSYQVDDLSRAYPPPPDALFSTMRAGMWLFRDANWSPDFPTSARWLAELYAAGQGRDVDGVIALDQDAVRALVSGVAPLEVGGSTPASVTGDNIIGFMREAWSPPGGHTAWADRKAFVGNLARAFQERIMSGGPVDGAGLARGLYTAFESRHLALWLRDSPLAASVHSAGWDGAIRTTDTNYLMVVDSNVGFNKANTLVTPSYAYDVDIQPDLTARATLTITYRHGGQPAATPCVQRVLDYGPNIPYESEIDQCYWDYLRVYVPKGTPLDAAPSFPIAGSQLLGHEPSSGEPDLLTAESDKDAFTSFFYVPRGGNYAAWFRYSTPVAAAASAADGLIHFRLLWQKQAGTGAVAVRIAAALPPGATYVSARVGDQPAAPHSDGRKVVIDFTLATDADIDLAFRAN